MKTHLTFLFLLLTSLRLITAQDNFTATSPPKIISTIPAFGDCDVDPALKEIIIKFDQDMQASMSLPNHKNMPEITGRPVWIDKRTLAVPVNLQSNRFYVLQCNTWKYRNFKNTKGNSLNPDLLLFQTEGNYTLDFSNDVYQEFMNIFPSMYSYAELKQVDWMKAIDQNKLADCKTNFEFTLKMMNVLKKAEDPHLWIDYKGEPLNPHSRKYYTLNYNIGEVVKVLDENKISENKIVVSGKYGDIGYIAIGTWDNRNKEEIRTAIDRLKEFNSLKNIIIDVRSNSGGNEELAKEFASCFISDPLPYGIIKNYNSETGKFDSEYIKTVHPNTDGFIYKGNVYILSGERCLSSNEGFILMMKQLKSATVVGMKTYGSSGNPKPYKLSDDITLYLPSWQAYTLDNKLIEGYGVKPDIEILNSSDDFNGKDALFEELIKIIEDKKP